MKRLLAIYKSTLGKKFIVAITGVAMIGFLLGHMTGNLKVFLPDLPNGTPDIDHYAGFLREIGVPMVPHAALLWAARMILLGSLVLHVVCVLQLSTANLSARKIDYADRRFSRATPPARWMMYTGGYLLFFLIVHLLHFTFGVLGSEFEHGQVYRNLHGSLSQLPWAAFYVISMLIVAVHLYHGVWSLFQTLGLDNPDRNRGLRRLAAGLAIVLFAGFVAVPTAFLTGVKKYHESSVEASQASRQIDRVETLDERHQGTEVHR